MSATSFIRKIKVTCWHTFPGSQSYPTDHFTPHVHPSSGWIGCSGHPCDTISHQELPSDGWMDILLCQLLLPSVYFSCLSCAVCRMSSNQVLWHQNDFVKSVPWIDESSSSDNEHVLLYSESNRSLWVHTIH